MIEAAQVLNVEAPDLYVRQNPGPNAYTLAISGKKPFVVVHTGLVELLTRKELQVSSYFMLYINSTHDNRHYAWLMQSWPLRLLNKFVSSILVMQKKKSIYLYLYLHTHTHTHMPSTYIIEQIHGQTITWNSGIFLFIISFLHVCCPSFVSH